MNLMKLCILSSFPIFYPKPGKEKAKRKGPLDRLPTSTEEWSTYDVPEEVLEAFSHPAMEHSGINNNTMVKPVSQDCLCLLTIGTIGMLGTITSVIVEMSQFLVRTILNF